MKSSKCSTVLPTEAKQGVSSSDFTYLFYKLSFPVFCTINFRQTITQGNPEVKVSPVKCGEGRKFTSEGVLQLPASFDLSNLNRSFNTTRIEYEPAASKDFVAVGKCSRIKLFFRGFPLRTSLEEIKQFFCKHGQVEYLYFMGPSKNGKALTSIQGYVIFEENETAHSILESKPKLDFFGTKIVCQEYQPNKKKKLRTSSAKKNEPILEGKQGSNLVEVVKEPTPQKEGQSGNSPKLGSNPTAEHSVVIKARDPECSVKKAARKVYLKHSDEIETNSKAACNVRFHQHERFLQHNAKLYTGLFVNQAMRGYRHF